MVMVSLHSHRTLSKTHSQSQEIGVSSEGPAEMLRVPVSLLSVMKEKMRVREEVGSGAGLNRKGSVL